MRSPSLLLSFALVLACDLAAGAQPGAPSSPTLSPAQATPAPKMEFDTFILVLLLRPPNAPELSKAEAGQLQEQHMANMKRLHAEGKLFKAGPVEDQSGRNVRGIFVLKTDSVEIARAWVETDPSIKRGRLVAEYLKWSVEKGSLK